MDLEMTITGQRNVGHITGIRFNRVPTPQEFAEWGRRRAATSLRMLGRSKAEAFAIAEHGDGYGVMIHVNDMPHFNKVYERWRVWDALRGIYHYSNTGMAMLISEVWIAEGKPGMKRSDLPENFKDYDLANEAVMISVETPQSMLLERYAIHRRGQRVRLGHLFKDSGVEASGGSLNLLYKVDPKRIPDLGVKRPGSPLDGLPN